MVDITYRLPNEAAEQVLAQTPEIGVTHMVDPATYAGIEIGKADTP